MFRKVEAFAHDRIIENAGHRSERQAADQWRDFGRMTV
jgi:hypothetical protein